MRLSIALAALFLLASGARGQQGPAVTAERAGGTSSDTAGDVAADLSGNVYVVGTVDGDAQFGSITVEGDETGCTFSTCHDAYLAKYGADGTALWVRRMGTPVHNDFAEGVAVIDETFGGGSPAVYVSGYFTGVATWDGGSNPDLSLTTRSDFDAFLARYTPEGDLEWVIQAGGADQDTGRGVAVDGDGNAYWTGSFSGTSTFGEGDDEVVVTSDGSSDGFVARISPEGNLDWLVPVGGQEGSDLYDAAVDVGGWVYVGGTFNGVAVVGSVPLQSRGSSDGYLVRLSATDGAVDWARQVGGSGDDHIRAVSAATGFTNTVIAGGWFSGQIVVGSDLLTSAGLTDVLVAAFDAEVGDEYWGRRAGGDGFDLAESVHAPKVLFPVTRGDGQAMGFPVFVTGRIDGDATFGDGANAPLAVAAQDDDAFLATYSLEFDSGVEPGGLRSAEALGGTGRDSGAGVTATNSFDQTPPSGNGQFGLYAIVAGTFQGAAETFGISLQSAGSNDLFVAKTSTCPALFCPATAADTPPEASGVRLSVSPHPASATSTLSVTLDRPQAVRVDLFDARGRRLATLLDGPQAVGEHPVALPALAPGTYLLRATTPEGTQSRVVTVAR